MATGQQDVEQLVARKYQHGFVTDIESDTVPPGLNEDVDPPDLGKKERAGVAARVAPEGLPALADDARAARGRTCTIRRSTTRRISYYSAPKSKTDGPKSLDEVDPKLLETYEKLGIPLHERARAGRRRGGRGVRQRLGRHHLQGQAGRSRASSSARSPRRCRSIRSWSSSTSARWCRYGDNFFAALNSAVFTDGSFVYIPKGVRCPMELSTYFRINAANTGQFERTLIVADEGSHVSYLEGCTAPMRDENQLHAAVVELVALDDAEIKYSTVQNWYPGDEEGRRRHLQLRHQARRLPRRATRRSPGPRSRPARPSPGSIRAASCAATTRWASSTRWRVDQQPASRPTPAPR